MEESTVDRVPGVEVSFWPFWSQVGAECDRWVGFLHDSEFTESVDSHQHHDTDDNEVDKLFHCQFFVVSSSPNAVFLQEKLVLHGRGHLQNQ